jgi:copper oxidase (laccase) domain-containing protein
MAVRKMRQEFGSDPADLLAFIGPAAGSCCYRVGEEVAAHFDEADVRRAEDGIFLDLKRANARQLGGEGIPASQMEISPSCTISDGAMFHSYRRDGVRSGRMLGVIALTGRKPAR